MPVKKQYSRGLTDKPDGHFNPHGPGPSPQVSAHDPAIDATATSRKGKGPANPADHTWVVEALDPTKSFNYGTWMVKEPNKIIQPKVQLNQSTPWGQYQEELTSFQKAGKRTAANSSKWTYHQNRLDNKKFDYLPWPPRPEWYHWQALLQTQYQWFQNDRTFIMVFDKLDVGDVYEIPDLHWYQEEFGSWKGAQAPSFPWERVCTWTIWPRSN